MVQYQIKLRPCVSQEKLYNQWLFHLASVHNWSVRKIELNARNKVYFTKQDFQNMLADHSPRLGMPSHTLQGVLCTVHDAWSCPCGTEHDRDFNAAVITLIAAAGYAVEVAYA